MFPVPLLHYVSIFSFLAAFLYSPSALDIDDANAAIQMASRISHAISEMNLVE